MRSSFARLFTRRLGRVREADDILSSRKTLMGQIQRGEGEGKGEGRMLPSRSSKLLGNQIYLFGRCDSRF